MSKQAARPAARLSPAAELAKLRAEIFKGLAITRENLLDGCATHVAGFARTAMSLWAGTADDLRAANPGRDPDDLFVEWAAATREAKAAMLDWFNRVMLEELEANLARLRPKIDRARELLDAP